MTKPTFRVFVSEHDGGKLVGVLMRRRERLFDRPAPSAWGDTLEDVLAALEPALIAAAADGDLDRYRFTETVELRRVAIEVRPRTAAGGVWVVGTRTVPVRIAYGAFAEGPVWRALVPRFGWSLALESLDDAGDVIRSAVFAATLGSDPSDVLDLRAAAREWIEPWALPRFTDDDDAVAEAEAPPPPTLAAVAEDWTGKLARKQLAPPVGELAHATVVATLIDAEPARSIVLVGEPGVGKTALVRRLAKHLGERDRGGARRRLWATSAAHITAGMTYLGMWQERCLTLARELAADRDWLYADRLVELCAAQADGATIGELWLPAIAAGELRVVVEASDVGAGAVSTALPGAGRRAHGGAPRRAEPGRGRPAGGGVPAAAQRGERAAPGGPASAARAVRGVPARSALPRQGAGVPRLVEPGRARRRRA
jgi:ATP-dependent Clp protease ATP-binding subunit ClpC